MIACPYMSHCYCISEHSTRTYLLLLICCAKGRINGVIIIKNVGTVPRATKNTAPSVIGSLPVIYHWTGRMTSPHGVTRARDLS